MSDPKAEQTSKGSPLSISDKVSIINALMEQDRIEIRDKTEAVFRLTYYVAPGFIGLAAFSVDHASLKNVLVIAQILLLALYVIAFLTFGKWLREARAYLRIREEFYAQQHLLQSEPFKPIRRIERKDRATRFEDNALWFPFGITVVSGAILLAFMFWQ